MIKSLLGYGTGEYDFLSIAEKMGLAVTQIREEIKALLSADLIAEVDSFNE